MIRNVARVILGICKAGIQVFVATHSLFLLREFEILLESEVDTVPQQYFALSRSGHGIRVSQGEDVGTVDPLLLLDEELGLSDRFLDRFMSGAES